MAETKEAKGHRILTEGRLVIREAVPDGKVIAECRGFSGEVYSLGWAPNAGRWGCTCPASSDFNRTCSHLIALKLVVTRP